MRRTYILRLTFKFDLTLFSFYFCNYSTIALKWEGKHGFTTAYGFESFLHVPMVVSLTLTVTRLVARMAQLTMVKVLGTTGHVDVTVERLVAVKSQSVFCHCKRGNSFR